MKKTYAGLLNMMVSQYIEFLTFMYYWDWRCEIEDREVGNPEVLCKIRNDYASNANGIRKVLMEEVDDNEITRYHEIAMENSKKMR